MAEINNNITNFGITNKKVENRHKEVVLPQAQTCDETEDQHYVQDTGVLGRSQVQSAETISKSVEEAVKLAQQYPELVEAGDKVFETVYEQFKLDGLSDEEAYTKASLAVEEFCEIGLAQLQ